MKDELKSFLPLAPAALHILLALAAEDRHGYGIMLEVARQSQGHYELGPGTLYDNLEKLMRRGLVNDAPRRSAGEDPRRRYYRLTAFGRRVLSADLERLRAVLKEAKAALPAIESRGSV
ncbi:MAG TPA: PadR family transcriptional regulator [Candidatus Acidoferrales bacterium]|nr:PadR family transcriptional regulator [Candidatus Acidoferrales bacterium]